MPTSPSHKYRRHLALAVVVLATLGAVAWYERPADPAASAGSESAPRVVTCTVGQFRYEYHVPTGTESLFDLTQDPRCIVSVLRAHRQVAAECRRRLEEQLGVADLSSLRAGYAESIRRLEALGYL